MVTLPPPEITPNLSGDVALSSDCDMPLHLQVQQLLRGAITQHFEDGQAFWPEMLLMERLGVSRNTVRKALNELARDGLLIQESTKARLVSKATTQVGIFAQTYNSEFRNELLHHLARICHDKWNCELRFFYTTDFDQVLSNFLRQGFSEHKIRLLLFEGAKRNLLLHNELRPRGYRTLMLDSCPPSFRGAFVGTDAAEAVRVGVNHLMSLGHRRITLLVNEPAREETVGVKIATFNELVKQKKIAQGEVHICRSPQGRNGFELAYYAMESIWRQPHRPTAVFTVSDPGAWGVLKWLGERHIEVPQAASVLGFENANSSAFTLPALSTVAHPVEELAHRAVEMLFEDEEKAEFLPPKLIVRDSTGKAPVESR